MRAVAPVLLSLGLVAALAGCAAPAADPGTGTGSTVIDGCQVTPAGAVSDAVTVTGELGSAPEVSFATPTAVSTTERTVAIAGDGQMATAGDTVHVDFTIYNGTSGDELSATGYDGVTTAFPIDSTQFLPGIVKALECSTVGSRVVAVIPSADSWGEAGSAELGVAPGDDIVFVVDIVSIVPPPLELADGVDQPAVAGMPLVELAEDGSPTVTIPDAEAPTELQLAVLKQGAGETVPAGADVTVHYHGVSWVSGEVFDSSWERGASTTFNTAGVIEGFTEALVGQQVGSQVLVVIPPAMAYGTDSTAHALGGQTLVFVIDILGVG